MSSIPVTHNAARHRFEVELDGEVGELTYAERPGVLVLQHTGVPPAIEGRGVGSALVRAALEHARAEGLKVVPQCPFVAAYLERHPEDHDLVAAHA